MALKYGLKKRWQEFWSFWSIVLLQDANNKLDRKESNEHILKEMGEMNTYWSSYRFSLKVLHISRANRIVMVNAI